MATKSFLKNIIIKNSKSAEKLLKALEYAENKKAKDVKINQRVEDIKDSEQIRNMFND